MSSAKLIFFGPPFAPSAAGASPTAPVETAPPAEGATAGSTAGSAIETGRAVPAGRVFSRLESPRLESPYTLDSRYMRRQLPAQGFSIRYLDRQILTKCLSETPLLGSCAVRV